MNYLLKKKKSIIESTTFGMLLNTSSFSSKSK